MIDKKDLEGRTKIYITPLLFQCYPPYLLLERCGPHSEIPYLHVPSYSFLVYD